MRAFVYHDGTGTIMDLTDCTLVVLTDEAGPEYDRLLEDEDMDEVIHRGYSEGVADSIDGYTALELLPWEVTL